MNKQEAIEELNRLDRFVKNKSCSMQKTDFVEFEPVIEIINQIDESQKPVIPQFVADWVEHCKVSGFSLRLAMAHWSMSEKLDKWMEYAENQEIFAKAWFYGYTVENQKLYTVEIPNPESVYPMILYKNDGGRVILGTCYTPENWKKLERNQLTESEIRKDFEWAWKQKFAKEVTQ